MAIKDFFKMHREMEAIRLQLSRETRGTPKVLICSSGKNSLLFTFKWIDADQEWCYELKESAATVMHHDSVLLAGIIERANGGYEDFRDKKRHMVGLNYPYYKSTEF